MASIDGIGAASAFTAAQYGLQNASEGISLNTDTNSTSPTSSSTTSRLTDDLIALNVNERNAQASAKVLGVADEMLGSIIDVMA